ncbi:MAG TPA: uracil-DNA glycosylase family protein, partial [Gaiellaceae bacterium]|nr:uracil-DNA glycosylase family protein [Gaiellaceae bacterium]
MEDAVERAAALREYAEHTAGCTRCALSKGRTQVVFGSGSPNADLMFVGEAPGFHEDQQGVPFVGQAGKLLDKLLAGIGLTRADVFVANVLKCLRYTAQVQLGDGSWERIGRLVRSRYDGTVMSVDDNGRLVPRRVIGWHATPRAGRRIFKLSYRSAKSAGLARVGVELTGDHPVLTMRGYVPAEELRPTDRIATGQGLSRLAHDVVCGTVLGDGHLNAASNHLFFAHSDSQSEYAAFKASLLEELEPRLQTLAVAAVAGGARTYGAVHVRTLAHRALGVLRRDFYRPKKHVPAWLGEELNDRMLAIWFMDDGYTRIRSGGRQPLAEIATVGFEDRDLQVLLRGLECLGLPAKAMRGRIYFDVSATAALSELIAPYVPASMRYKLHPEVEQRVPYDPDRLRRGETEVLYDEVEIEEIVRHEGPDRTYFCIDVEETHNFVTAGGVVHNCRPPGNRDPLPDEIAACEPHLFRQIELIEPKLVATLGNFATKLLSGKPAGITRVHGYEQEVTLGSRTVSLYPLYHPAAALYTPSMLKVLEEDFARIPDLLARAVEPVAPDEPVPAVEPEPEAVQ